MYFLFFYSFNVRFCLKADGKGALPTKLGKYSMDKLYIMVLHMQLLINVLGCLNNYSDVIFFFIWMFMLKTFKITTKLFCLAAVKPVQR